MTTNERRREIAESLREMHEDISTKGLSVWTDYKNWCEMIGPCALADIIEPEPEPTFDEWLKDVKKTCFSSMEGCDEPEWSLFSTINDAIDFYFSGKSGFECKEIDYGE